MANPDKAQALAALAANNGAIRRTARELGMSETTLRRWSGARKSAPSHQPERDLLARLKDIAWQLAGDLEDPEKRKKANLRDIGIVFGILSDKIERLEQLRQERDDPLAQLIETIGARRGESASPNETGAG